MAAIPAAESRFIAADIFRFEGDRVVE